MWGALENMAVRHSLPAALRPGDTVKSILVSGQLAGGRHMLRFLGYRRSVSYLLRQFYSVNTRAFMRWQNEARYRAPGPDADLLWPQEEWNGGLIYPLPQGAALPHWLSSGPGAVPRLRAGLRLARVLSRLHAAGFAHRGLCPGCIFVSESRTMLGGFGLAARSGLDDLWSDTVRGCCSPAHDAPEVFTGQESGAAQDVFSFGALLRQLTVGTPPFGPLGRGVRWLAPSLARPAPFPVDSPYPDRVGLLVDACLAPVPDHRPTMAEVLQVLEDCVDTPESSRSGASCPSTPSTAAPASSSDPFSGPSPERASGSSSAGPGTSAASQAVSIGGDGRQDCGGEAAESAHGADPDGRSPARIMVFVKGDELTAMLMDTVLHMAEREPCAFLFVGLVPLNLPSGHEQLFKGRLFRRLGEGLRRCRRAGVLWSLRVFENVDAERAGCELVELYRPDMVLLGRAGGGAFPMRRGFASGLERMGMPVRVCSEPR